MVHSAQTVHLSCVKISTISKWTKTSFHLSLVTAEYQWVRPKRLLSLRYVWRKPCTYLALTLTPSRNGPKQDMTWPTPPRGSIGCVQIDFSAYGTFSALSPNSPKRASTWASSTWSTIGCIQNDFLTLWYIWHKPCTYLALRLTPSWNRPKRDSIWATSPRCSIGFVQNDFQTYGTFGANCAPILHRH
jgi:hypothetical protein